MEYTETEYNTMLEKLFVRFPSYQNVGGKAYKPGLDNMLFFDQLLGHPHRKYKTIHIAGTDGKGSVSNMLASVLAAHGLKTGLYTSPHILDFRERMRIIDGNTPATLIPKDSVMDFVSRWQPTFEHLDLSFFEITTMMAFDWFARENVDVAVIETGLGGRLDSTNIISPVLDIITNIGLDHCAILGNTLSEIAFEKAGIIKPRTPVVIGESHPETDGVFERKVLYTNLSEPEFMGDRTKIMSLLTFADKLSPSLWTDHETILDGMDLQGDYQRKNLRTVLAALDVLRNNAAVPAYNNFSGTIDIQDNITIDAIAHTAARTGFHGRWERLSEHPWIIADIGHNSHGLKYNFAQLRRLREEGRYEKLLMVFGMVADKDIEAVLPLLPTDAEYFFTNSSGSRALPAEDLRDKYMTYLNANGITPPVSSCYGTVGEALAAALSDASATDSKSLIYIGGSTFVVSEAVCALKNL